MKGLYTYLRCTLCNRQYAIKEHKELMTCPECGEKGILDVQYDYEKAKSLLSYEQLKENKDPSIWRYLPLLPIDEYPRTQLLQVGDTPLYHLKRLGKKLGMEQVYMKDDGLNPTGSLKDRASIVAVVKALEEKKGTICCSSTGNAASSLAGNAGKVGLKTVIFVPKRAPEGKLSQLLIYGSNLIIIDGDYKETFLMSKEVIHQYGFYNRNAAINPYLIEGKKTVVFEIMEQLNFNEPDWIVVSVGDGCTIGGVYKGLKDLKTVGLIEKMPKLLGVQASGCNPFEMAFLKGEPIEETGENTLADSIAVGIPRNPVKGMQAVIDSKGFFISVSDEEILETMGLVGRLEGIYSEPAAAAASAGLIKALREGYIDPSDKVVVINTGNGLKDIASGLKAVELPLPIQASKEIVYEVIERMDSDGNEKDTLWTDV